MTDVSERRNGEQSILRARRSNRGLRLPPTARQQTSRVEVVAVALALFCVFGRCIAASPQLLLPYFFTFHPSHHVHLHHHPLARRPSKDVLSHHPTQDAYSQPEFRRPAAVLHTLDSCDMAEDRREPTAKRGRCCPKCTRCRKAATSGESGQSGRHGRADPMLQRGGHGGSPRRTAINENAHAASGTAPINQGTRH